MSRNKHGFKRKPTLGEKGRQALENIDENNPVIKMFVGFRDELDSKHDRYEKVVKLSRDITIETKRIIFFLHSMNTDIESKRTAVLEEAWERLMKVVEGSFKSIAVLLKGLDQWQYQKAYTNGLQEFLEAVTFYQFLSSGTFNSWNSIEKHFSYEEEGDHLNLLVPQVDFILGIADCTGELMRRCINCLGVGNTSDCFKICNFVKAIYTGFIGVTSGTKEIGRKIYTLKQSLSKMELVCYNIQLRGSEVPDHMLLNVIESGDVNPEDDEGYY